MDKTDPAVWGVRLVAATCCLLLAVRGIGYTVTLGAPLGALTVLSTWRWMRLRLNRWIIGLLVATVVLAPVVTLVALTVGPTRTLGFPDFVRDLGNFVALLGIASGMVFGCRKLGLAPAAALVGAGAVLDQVLRPDVEVDTLWKFRLAWSVPVLLLALLGRAPRAVQLVAVSGLGAIALASASRNNLTALGVAGVIVAVSLLVGRASSRRGRIRVAASGMLAASIPVVAIGLLPTVFRSGDLGADIQRRTLNQTDDAGFLGGRFEYGASWALFRDQPWGYGPGTAPSARDLNVAVEGLQAIGVDVLGGGYTEEYILTALLTDRLRLHSILAEFWLRGGPIAAAVVLLVGVLLCVTLVRVLTNVQLGATALVAFCCTQSLWDLLFSPVRPNAVWVLMTAGIAIYVGETLGRDGPAARAAGEEVRERPGGPPGRAGATAARAARGPNLTRRGRAPTPAPLRRNAPPRSARRDV